MNLTDKKWLPFKIGDLFYKFEQGKCKNASELKEGNIPYVGATNRNNGVLKFVEYNEKIITKGNCIIFISQGDGSAGYSIYKKENCICGSTVIAAYSDFLNEYVGMFITCCSDMNQSKYSHGYARSLNRLKRDYIMLPVNERNLPDYKFMEDYIKNTLFGNITKLKKYCSQRVSKINYKEIKNIDDKRWKEFNIKEIFPYVNRGKRLKKHDHKIGSIPYISSKMENNGVDSFIANKNGKNFYDCLTIANSGSVGSSFYHPYKFIGSDHITALKNEKFNEYIYLFLSTVVSKIGEKYSFNREINDFRISNEKILLPINEKEEPDYEYMEQYIKNIMLDQYNRYLQFLED